MRRDGTLLFTPTQVFGNLAAACGGGVVVIAILARDRAPAIGAAVSFGFAMIISVLLATMWGEGAGRLKNVVRIGAVTALGVSAALPGWFFGPSSAYAGVLALVLLFAGLLMGGVETPFPARGGWFVYVGLAGGQAIVAALVLTGRLDDVGLLPVLPAGATTWHHIAAHITVQLVYAAAFGIGRAFHQRYWVLSEQLDVAIRASARRSALLDEARAEYRRTFALGREGIFAGQTIGRYHLGALIGRGGAGEVYDARDTVDGSRAAVKLLRGDRLDDPVNVRGFLEEATSLTLIESPHVVRTRHVGGLEGILPYIAMERLEGKNLAELIARSGRLSRAALRQLIDHGARALAAVHGSGITHGDVQPTNLVLVGETWKLIDFGSPSLAEPNGDPGRVIGMPRFVAPEVLAGGRRDASSDLYGLCASIYTAITGREPFAEVARATLPAVVACELPADPRLRGEIDDQIADALAIGLAPDREARYPDAVTLRANLLAAFDGMVAAEVRVRAAALPAWRTADPVIESEPTLAPASGSHTEIEPVPVVEPVLAATTTSLDVVASTAWHGAFTDKMRLQYAGVLIACAVGAVLIALIVEHRAVRLFGWGTIAAAAGVVALARWRRLDWPWAIVATLAIGPSYILGLHSGFAAVVAVTLFVDGSFRSATSAATGRWVLIAVVATSWIAFGLIRAGVIPDSVVTPVLHHEPAWSGFVIQLCVTAVYVTAFVLGRAINGRYADLVRRNEEAARDAANKEALLASARAEVERVLEGYAGGLFTGSRIGTYDVGRLLGRGGMGEVYVASRDGVEVALKVIRADRAGSAANLKRFGREAEALLRVESPYVARVLDVGTEDGRLPFLAMELVAGSSLAEQLHGSERLELAVARQLCRDVARGLADVHRAGVVHRDIKPHNLVLTTINGAPRWKLVDFGIAKLDGAVQATTGRVIVGTPAYMAPEQLAGRPADARSDLYSLCLVVFRVLAGRPAFSNNRVTQTGQHPPDPCRVPDLPLDVGLALRIGLATSPADRFASASDLEAAFDAAFAGRLEPGIRDRAHALRVQEPWE